MADSVASLIQEDRLLNNLVLAAQALCCYDYCITFASEVKYVWSRKFSLAAALFYAFRYSAVLNTLFIALGYFPWRNWNTSHSCVIIIRFEMAGDVLILTTSTVFTAMRVFALFHRSLYLFGFSLVLGLIAPVITAYSFIRSTPILYEITPGYQVCYIETANVVNYWMMGARASSLVFDGFVFGMTWWGTRRATALGGSKAVLMRDTAIYFGFLFALNVLAIGIAAVHLTFIVVVNTWTAILTSVLLSRLMLDLREVIADLLPSDTSRHTYGSRSTSLSRTLGSLHFTQRGAAPPEEISIELSPVSPGASRRGAVSVSEAESWTLGGDEGDI